MWKGMATPQTRKGDFPHRWLQIGEDRVVKALFLGNQG